MTLNEWLSRFTPCFEYPHKGCSCSTVWFLHGWCHSKLLPSKRNLCTPYNHAPCHFMQSHVRKVYACLAVTCHLHFWQNDQDLLHATAVTRGWNGYGNRSQHRKLTLQKKILRLGFEPATFQSWVRCSNHWAIPTPNWPENVQILLVVPPIFIQFFCFTFLLPASSPLRLCSCSYVDSLNPYHKEQKRLQFPRVQPMLKTPITSKNAVTNSTHKEFK